MKNGWLVEILDPRLPSKEWQQATLLYYNYGARFVPTASGARRVITWLASIGL
jgi:hypothetical protein